MRGGALNQITNIRKNIDAKTVTSVVVGMALFGGIVYAAASTKIKPLREAAKVVKGGK